VREPRGEYGGGHGDPVDCVELTSLHKLPDWMLPAVTWTEPVLDKTGEVAEQLRAVTSIDPATAGEPLDGYINMLYRSLKNARVGNELAARESSRRTDIPSTAPRASGLRGRAGYAAHECGDRRSPISRAESAAKRSGRSERRDIGWEPDVASLRGE
jgi:hypothetical protein